MYLSIKIIKGNNNKFLIFVRTIDYTFKFKNLRKKNVLNTFGYIYYKTMITIFRIYILRIDEHY